MKQNQKNSALPPSIANSLKQKTGHILEQNETGLLIYDEAGKVFMLYQPDERAAFYWIQKHLADCPDQSEKLLLVLNPGLEAMLSGFENYERFTLCRSFTWPLSISPLQAGRIQKPAVENRLRFEPVLIEEIPEILADYNLASEEELAFIIENGMLFWGVDPAGNRIGFSGFHPEGSMGLLHVSEAFRNRGYALQLENFLIETALEKGLIPCCDVFENNQASLNLQKKLGLREEEHPVIWGLFRPSESPTEKKKEPEEKERGDKDGKFSEQISR